MLLAVCFSGGRCFHRRIKFLCRSEVFKGGKRSETAFTSMSIYMIVYSGSLSKVASGCDTRRGSFRLPAHKGFLHATLHPKIVPSLKLSCVVPKRMTC